MNYSPVAFASLPSITKGQGFSIQVSSNQMQQAVEDLLAAHQPQEADKSDTLSPEQAEQVIQKFAQLKLEAFLEDISWEVRNDPSFRKEINRVINNR